MHVMKCRKLGERIGFSFVPRTVGNIFTGHIGARQGYFCFYWYKILDYNFDANCSNSSIKIILDDRRGEQISFIYQKRLSKSQPMLVRLDARIYERSDGAGHGTRGPAFAGVVRVSTSGIPVLEWRSWWSFRPARRLCREWSVVTSDSGTIGRLAGI